MGAVEGMGPQQRGAAPQAPTDVTVLAWLAERAMQLRSQQIANPFDAAVNRELQRVQQAHAQLAELIGAHAGLLAMVESGISSLGAIRRSRAAQAAVEGRRHG